MPTQTTTRTPKITIDEAIGTVMRAYYATFYNAMPVREYTILRCTTKEALVLLDIPGPGAHKQTWHVRKDYQGALYAERI